MVAVSKGDASVAVAAAVEVLVNMGRSLVDCRRRSEKAEIEGGEIGRCGADDGRQD